MVMTALYVADSATRSALVIGRVHWKSFVSGSRNGLSPPTSTLTRCRRLRRLSSSVFSSGLKMMPPAHSERIQSTERSGPVHTSESRPPGRSTRATSGTARASSTQCQADWAMTTSTDDEAAGISSAWPASDLDPCVSRGQDGAHAVVGFDGGQVVDPFGEQPREDAGAGPDLEDVGRILGKEPVERFIRGA